MLVKQGFWLFKLRFGTLLFYMTIRVLNGRPGLAFFMFTHIVARAVPFWLKNINTVKAFHDFAGHGCSN